MVATAKGAKPMWMGVKKLPRLTCAKSKKEDRRIKEECFSRAWVILDEVSMDLDVSRRRVRKWYRKGKPEVVRAVEERAKVCATAVCGAFGLGQGLADVGEIVGSPDWEEIFATIIEFFKMILPFLVLLF